VTQPVTYPCSSPVPPYARLTTRLKERIVTALSGEVRCVDAVAAELGVSWPTAMRQLTRPPAHAAATAARPALVYSLGIDEHRFRTVRWYKDDARRVVAAVEPWMTTFTNLATGQVIGVVDGRDSAAVKTWLKTRPRWWRHRVRVVAIDPSAAFRSAVRSWLPKARVSVDHFHLIKLANDMVTTVRRRVSWDRHDRRGRAGDLTWANRLLLMRGYDSLSERGRAKLKTVLHTDDPTNEISAAWAVKEQLRRLLACTNVADAQRERATFNRYVSIADDARDHPPEARPSTRGGRPSPRSSEPAPPTPRPKPRTSPSRTSNASAADTARTPTTDAASCSTTPPGWQRDQPNRPQGHHAESRRPLKRLDPTPA
jgi:transposase